MKKSSLLATALVVMLASPVMATEADPHAKTEAAALPAGPVVTGDVYIGPMNKYLFRGNELNADKSFVIQGGIDLSYEAFTLSYWTNHQNRNTGYRKSKTTESDLILDYTLPTVAEKLSLNVGTQYFSLDGAEDTNEFYLKGSYDTLLAPALAVYWDNLEASEEGLFYTASISHSVPVKGEMLTLNLGALASYNQHNPSAAYTDDDSRSGIYSGWHNYELTAGLDYKPAANITITPSYTFSNNLSDKAEEVGIGAQNCYGVKLILSF